MRHVTYTDDNGYIHRTLIKDDDPDSMAKYGLPQDPPDIERIDWDGFKRELHNAMVEGEIFTLRDVMRQANGLSVLVHIVKRHLFALYEQEEAESDRRTSIVGG